MSESTRNRRLTKPRDYPNTRSHQRRTTIDDLPAETLSLIFEEVIPVEPDLDEIYGYEGNVSRCLRQAVILSSVSIHLRRAAFGTPELWKRLPLNMDKPIDALVPLLQHCTSHAISLHISITRDHWGQSDAQTLSKAKILLSPNTSEKLELLDLYRSDAPEHWIPLLTSFPMLKTLIIGEGGIFSDEDVRLDLGALSKLTQIFIEARFMDSAILPSSIQVLHLANVPQNVQVSLLPQCPNLVTCTNLNDMDYVYDNFAYTEPVTLNHLKRLTWLIDSGLKTAAAVQNIQMPVLEYLTLYSFETIPTIPPAVISICCQVSATLTAFQLNVMDSGGVWQYDDFCDLLSLPLHNLTTMGMQIPPCTIEPFIRALIPGSDGCNTPETHYLPSLKYLTLESHHVSDREREEYVEILPPLLLHLLKSWRVGETSYFFFKLCTGANRSIISSWASEQQRELKAITRDRQIDFQLC